jgi:hypothetical protein
MLNNDDDLPLNGVPVIANTFWEIPAKRPNA